MFIVGGKWHVNQKEQTITLHWQKLVLYEQTSEVKAHFDNLLQLEATWRLTSSADLAWNDDHFLFPENIFITSHWLRWRGCPQYSAWAKVIKVQLYLRQLADAYVQSDLQGVQK